MGMNVSWNKGRDFVLVLHLVVVTLIIVMATDWIEEKYQLQPYEDKPCRFRNETLIFIACSKYKNYIHYFLFELSTH